MFLKIFLDGLEVDLLVEVGVWLFEEIFWGWIVMVIVVVFEVVKLEVVVGFEIFFVFIDDVRI